MSLLMMPTAESLQRKANRHRKSQRPSEPTDLEFAVNQDYLNCGDYIIADLRVDRERHILFSTPRQLEILRSTKRWFMDGTFKIVDRPFRGGQLMSIHGFIQFDGKMKQIPLLFALMSRRKKEDYVAVLGEIKSILGAYSVEGFVVDFEAGSWGAIRHVFPGVEIKGCVFHWAQSVWRHVQAVGLGPAYMERKDLWDYVRKLLVLPFVPSSQIEPLFRNLAQRANTEPLRKLVNYIDSTWIQSLTFPIQSWCIYGLHVRTNNDVEGFHTRLNGVSGGRSLTFYKLVPALRKQALEAELDIDQLVDNSVGRRQRNQYRECDRKIFDAWRKYEAKEISTSGLLRLVSRLYGAAEYKV
ncbi:uncharacterized protein LOC127864714 [Dreissena polymorpha]|uniref:uncharacterized protein LOC127864714 n=1 Tax=Dreissena polymorpha TaxID=45954 RepID=UPI00226492C6|nr:uncharacterized protein LOC127864714 [Dreissena polymorpha]